MYVSYHHLGSKCFLFICLHPFRGWESGQATLRPPSAGIEAQRTYDMDPVSGVHVRAHHQHPTQGRDADGKPDAIHPFRKLWTPRISFF